MQQIGERNNAHQERAIVTWNGFVALAIGLLLLAAGIWQLLRGMPYSGPPSQSGLIAAILTFVVLFMLGLLILAGLYTLQPNEAVILQLFGSYRGSSRVPGCAAPILSTAGARSRCAHAISTASGSRSTTSAAIRSRSPRSSSGASTTRREPVSTSTTTRTYVKLQSEAAVRHLASSFAYDHADTPAGSAPEPTLLASADIVSRALVVELQQRLDKAGSSSRKPG